MTLYGSEACAFLFGEHQNSEADNSTRACAIEITL